jgi:hypothetical protein
VRLGVRPLIAVSPACWLLASALASAQPSAAAPSAAADPASSAPAAAPLDHPMVLSHRPPSIDDASALPLPPMLVEPAPPARDGRPMVWLGGLMVLAAMFLWNRHRRQELERLDAAASRGADRERRDPDDAAVQGRGDGDPGDAPSAQPGARRSSGSASAAAPAAAAAPATPALVDEEKRP